MSKISRLVVAVSAVLALVASWSRAAELGGVPVLENMPKSTTELAQRLQDFPSAMNLALNGDILDTGTQFFLDGPDVPLGPAPHIPWARPLAGGPLKVIVINFDYTSFDTAEMERRLDCRVRRIHLPENALCSWFPEAVNGYFSDQALKVLQEDANVILADSSVRFLRPDVADALLKKVANGCGLVLLGCKGEARGYWLPETKAPAWLQFSTAMVKSVAPPQRYVQHRVISPDGLFQGIPFALLPPYSLQKMEPAAGVAVLAQDGDCPLALGKTIGQGRAALLAWSGRDGCFPDVADNINPPRVANYQDYYASAVIRLLLWASGRPAPVTFKLEQNTLAAGSPATVTLSLDGNAPTGGKLTVHLHELGGQEVTVVAPSLSSTTAAVKIPALAAGSYLLDAILRDAQGASRGWGSFALNVTAPGTVAVRLDKEEYQPGEPVVVAAQTDGLPGGAYTATLRVRDALDRLLVEQKLPLAGGKAQWTFANRDPLCVLHYADVEIERDGRPYLASRTDIFVPRYTFTDFRNCLWGAPYLPIYASKRVERRLRENAGVDVELCGGYGGTQRTLNYRHLASGVWPFYTNVAYLDPTRAETAPLAVAKETQQMVEAEFDELRKFGGSVIFFQDERHGFNDCGTPTAAALGEFRHYLPTRYHDIAELNAVWGRNYQSFDEVQPVLTKQFEPSKEKSLAPWLEWRLWVMQVIVNIDRTSARSIRQALGHDAWMGLEGIFGLEDHNIPYGGLDLAAQSENCFNAAAPYSESCMNVCQSFYPGPSFAWAGYSSPYSSYQRYVWGRALQGDWSLGWFNGATFYTPFDCFLPQAKWVADLTRPLREGVGKLLVANRPIQREPIAFLYSQSSLYSMCVLGRAVDPDDEHLFVRPASWARESLQRLFNDLGVQYRYLSEKNLQQGQGKGLKLIVLSSCVALAPATCQALEKFVAAGGVVLADFCPGVWDDRGGYHQPGQLDSLFGVKRAGKFAVDTMPADYSVGITDGVPGFQCSGDWLIGQYFEKTLQVADGQALGKHFFGPIKPPAFVFKRTGKGATLLMNYLETIYRMAPEEYQRRFAAEVLRLAGITAPIALFDRSKDGEPLQSGVIVSRWLDGPAEYVGILLDQGKRVDVKLPKSGYLYEISHQARYLGNGDAATLDLRDDPYALLAVMPYKVDAVNLKVAGLARLGQALPLEFALQISGSKPVKHVVHLDVYQPDGKLNYSYSRNFVFQDGQWTGALPLALNDPRGRWTIKARDVVSGLSAETVVEVRRPPAP